MPVPKDVYDFLVDSHPSLADLALWVREVVLAGEPDLTERVYLGWDGIGFRPSRRRLRVRYLPT